MWSLGVLLYEVAALTHPFVGSNLVALVKVIGKGNYRPLPEIYSAELRTLVAKMLSARPKDRPTAARVAAYADEQLKHGARAIAIRQDSQHQCEANAKEEDETKKGGKPQRGMLVLQRESKLQEIKKTDEMGAPKRSKRDIRLARRAQERKERATCVRVKANRPQTAAARYRRDTPPRKDAPSPQRVPSPSSPLRAHHKRNELAEAYRELAIRANARSPKNHGQRARSRPRKREQSTKAKSSPSKHSRFNLITGSWE